MKKYFEQREKSHLLVVNSSHKMRDREKLSIYIYASRKVFPRPPSFTWLWFRWPLYFWQTDSTTFWNKLINVSKHKIEDSLVDIPLLKMKYLVQNFSNPYLVQNFSNPIPLKFVFWIFRIIYSFSLTLKFKNNIKVFLLEKLSLSKLLLT